MPVRFADGFHIYHVYAGLGPDGGERVPVRDAADARRLLAGARQDRIGDATRQLRRLLRDTESVAPLYRLSDREVLDRLAAHLAAGRLRAWRTRAPVWGRADTTAPLAGSASAEAADAPLAPAETAAAVEAAVSDELPSCRQAWAEIDAETAAVLARGGDRNPIERNRHVTAAYARYYQRTQAAGTDNPWGGVAAIVSRQAGCSMAYADVLVAQPQAIPGGPLDSAYNIGGTLVKDALADTNKYIFEDIYPVLRMHEEHGMTGIERCGPVRPGPSGPVSQEMRDALQLIDRGGEDDIRDAGILMARYEQTVIVQDKILNNPITRGVFRANQRAAETELGRSLGARKPELALTAECPPYPPGTEAVPFEGDFTVTRNRVRYYERLARSFGRMPAADKARTLDRLARRGQ